VTDPTAKFHIWQKREQWTFDKKNSICLFTINDFLTILEKLEEKKEEEEEEKEEG
jgi:hypothetical protein